MTVNRSPGQSDSTEAYVRLAEQLIQGAIEEEDLANSVSSMPNLSQEELDVIASLCEEQAHINPQFGWALAKVANETAVFQKVDLSIQARADWYLGRAANHFFQPHRASNALSRARAGFILLKDEDWLAACDWQDNALPWAVSNLQLSATAVQSALDKFSIPDSPLTHLRNNCTVTLAYIQVLIGNFPEALDLLKDCEMEFVKSDNKLGVIRCRLIRANLYRRQSKNSEALDEINDCLRVSREIPAPVEEALDLLQLGNIYLKNSQTPGKYDEAEEKFMEGGKLFKSLNVLFWEALADLGLAGIYISRGQLAQAAEKLIHPTKVFQEFNLAAPLAESLIIVGWLETYRANYDLALKLLEQAAALGKQVGNNFVYAMGAMHLGETYLEMGRYQQALHYLELAIDHFQDLKATGRVAESGLRLARCWTGLGRHEQAFETLGLVEKNAQAANQKNIFPYLYVRQAETYFVSKKQSEAIERLKIAISTALEYEDNSGAALAQRLLGEAQIDLGDFVEGAKDLRSAEKAFNQIGMVIEQAACKIVWGQYYQKLGDGEQAKESFQQAARIGKNLAPDIIWQAEAGLANLAEEAGNDSEAMEHYRKVISALVRLREGMWQPALSGYLIKRPNDTLEKALRLSVKVKSPEDVANAIEAGKAQVMANLFKRQYSAGSIEDSPELANLAADIRWRQERARVTSNTSSWLKTANLRKLRSEIQELVKSYDDLRGRLERRQRIINGKTQSLNEDFNLTGFKQSVNRSFGKDWLAIDYFLTANHLTFVLITSQSFEFHRHPIPGRVKLLFSDLDIAYSSGEWERKDLELLGKWLLPEAVVRRLTPETTFFIAPHRQLHRLPWPALFAADGPLVSKAVPVVVPSLQSLTILCERREGDFSIDKGLLVAVTDFNGRYPKLSKTVEEVDTLHKLWPNSKQLINKEATLDQMIEVLKLSESEKFSFMHLATHAFADKVSGRLNGLALYDRDIWLDELWELPLLPRLVTLSACSGSMSRVYEGDEQVGLATTCLAAGALHVIASLWPIDDTGAAEFMESFYSYLQLDFGVARALAEAQRKAINEDKPLVDWAGFRFNGLPE